MKFVMAIALIFGISTAAVADIHQDILDDFVNQVPVYTSDFNFNSNGNMSGNNNGNGGNTGTTPVAQVPEPGQFLLFLTGAFIGWFFIRTAQQKRPSAFHVGAMFVVSLFLFYLSITPAKAQVLQPVNSGITQNGNNQSASTSWSWSDSNSSSSVISNPVSNSVSNASANPITNSSSISDASNSGNNQSMNFETHRSAPSMFMTSPNPTANCQAVLSGGFSAFIFGGIFGAGSYTLEQCEIREEARIAYGIGQQDMAKEILCMSKYAKQTEACKEFKKD